MSMDAVRFREYSTRFSLANVRRIESTVSWWQETKGYLMERRTMDKGQCLWRLEIS